MPTEPIAEPALSLADHTGMRKVSPTVRERFVRLAAEHDARGAPPVEPTFLFNSWAFLFGPLYYFRFRLWRKGLILLILFMLPLFMPDDAGALAGILAAEYAGTQIAFSAYGLLFPILLFSGRTFTALLSAVLILGAALYVHMQVSYLDLGVSSGFIWLLSRAICPVIGATLLFYALSRNIPAFLSTLLCAILIYKIGFPLQGFALSLVLSDMLRVLSGFMATRDRFRRTILEQKFWW